jgi:hypothetical protein
VTSRSNPPAVRTAPGKQQSRPEGKAVKAAAPKESWRRALKPGDEGEVQKWVEQSGLERVARIIASLANARVGVGRTERPDSLLLLKMAFLVREHPERSLHSIAIEVARDAQSHQKVRIALESLTSKLRRDFTERRQVWLSLARKREVPNERAMHEDASRRRSGDENRILGRLINLLPDAIDLYDDVLREARRAGLEKEKLVRRLGRGRVEPLLEDAIARFQSTGSFDNVEGVGVPRTLFDLIEAKLLRTQEELTGAAGRGAGLDANPTNKSNAGSVSGA